MLVLYIFLKINSSNGIVVFILTDIDILNRLYSFYFCIQTKQIITNSQDRKVKTKKRLCQLVLNNILAKKMSPLLFCEL